MNIPSFMLKALAGDQPLLFQRLVAYELEPILVTTTFSNSRGGRLRELPTAEQFHECTGHALQMIIIYTMSHKCVAQDNKWLLTRVCKIKARKDHLVIPKSGYSFDSFVAAPATNIL